MRIILFIIALAVQQVSLPCFSQSVSPKDAIKTVTRLDSIFWVAYNKCDVETMASFIADDVEFYHDRAGVTRSKALLIPAFSNGLCGNPNSRLRREAIEGSVQVFPMDNYGAIITGEHIFYVKEPGRDEYLDGYGKFAQLWQHTDGSWKMTRILSYDHKAPPYINKRKAVTVAKEKLIDYAGNYQSGHAGVFTVECDDQSLRVVGTNLTLSIYPENDHLFFAKDRDLQFEFIRSGRKISHLIVYEKGARVEEAKRLK